MANQISIASIMMSWCEGLTYAQKAGLDPARVIASIGGGAAGELVASTIWRRARCGRNFDPGFYVKHLLKDMRIALDSAEAMQLDLPGLKQAKQLYDEVAARGWAEDGTQALLRLYQQRA
jgi:3-hydroxyisobutyrate dehydrogenase